MSKLALLTFVSLLVLTVIVPKFGLINGQPAAAAQSETVARSSEWFSIMTLVVGLLALYFASKLLASQHEPNVCVYDHNSSHYWLFSNMVIAAIPLHCTICHSLLLTVQGRFCSSCGIGCCTESACWRKANTTQKCKEIALLDEQTVTKKKSRTGDNVVAQSSNENEKPEPEKAEVTSRVEDPVRKFRHHWVAGNLPLNSECEVCEESCGDSPGIVDLRCCWCQRTVHSSCQPQLSEVCDLGEFRQFIVPPFCVVAKSGRTVRHPLRKVVSKIVNSNEFLSADEWSPLIVIGNRKSGSKDTSAILANFRSQLNPAQVIDLDECQMEDGLKWSQLIGDSAKKVFCLIAGGDGTISWVLNTIDKMNLPNPPAIALFPIGTGNDLARSLGYGAGSDSSENVRDVMRRIQSAEVTMLDRWKVDLKQSNWRFGMLTQSPKELFMQNYLSIGVDALVTYNFSKARESPFYLIPSRIVNKLIYFMYGTKDVLERACKNLDKVVEVYMDGEKVDLPNIESVVVLNIPNWGAGVKPWTLGSGHLNFPPSSFNDTKLEVFCVFSSFHIAQMQVGLSEPHRLGQAREVKICIYAKVPIQIDGEPWVQHPAEITITHHKQVPVLRVGSH